MKLRVVGLDPSLRNLGIAKGFFDTETKKLTIDFCITISPNVPKGSMRVGTRDILRVRHLLDALAEHIKEADIVIAEIPIGSQSASAMKSYAVCIALMAVAQKIMGKLVEVTPQQVKTIVGNPKATKADVIHWVQKKHPEAPLERYRDSINAAKAEHQADAIVAIYAGLKTLQS
jgi:Holliday junction resolvasome RuvABC endonuclease subunit